jgi:endonuclease/exonuclease/phosphatase family metal-dependent hydrolase/regulation of enolase protein 1 (concanavalin A-like superfamily)
VTRAILRSFAAALLALTSIQGIAFAQSLPAGWATKDIGPVGAAGSGAGGGGSFTVAGSGENIWDTSDQFRFVYLPLTGDGAIVSQVASVQYVDTLTKAGVMMRETLTSVSRQASMLVTAGSGLNFYRRTVTNGVSTKSSAVSGAAPRFVRMTRSGNVFTASTSTDGVNWTDVGSETIAMASTVYVGLAVTSHKPGTLATVNFASTEVTSGAAPPPPPPPTGSLQSGWATKDIGPVGAAGDGFGGDGSFTLTGAGANIWDTSDQFRFVYMPLTGDGTIVSQVVSIQNVDPLVKAGVMMRETLSSVSRQASMLVTSASGLNFYRRTVTNGLSTKSAGVSGAAPKFVKLSRSGSVFTAFTSVDGVAWTQVGSDTINMASTIYVGLAVTSHITGVLATANFASTEVTTTAAAPPPPPPPTSATTLRVLHWNVRHGGTRTDGVYDPNGLTTWMASWAPDVISLNEIDNATQATTIVNYMNQKTGLTWNYRYDDRGNVVMSHLPATGNSICVTNASVGRKATHLGVLVNGRPLNVWSGHFALDSSAVRLAEAVVLQACELLWPEARIVAMDFNAQPDTAEYISMLAGHTDSWRSAPQLFNYSGNCDGCTKNSRIDYVWTSRGASWLSLKSAQIFDTRNAAGVMPSDHKPLLVVYDVAP